MYLERLQNVITAATYVSVPQQMKGFSMRWVSQIGLSTRYCSVVKVLYLSRPVTNADYPVLEKLSESAIKDRQKFERLVVSKEKLLEMFNVPFPFHSFQTYAHTLASITNISNISSKQKSRMVVLPLSTVVDPWSIFALVLISPTQAKSRLSWSPK